MKEESEKWIAKWENHRKAGKWLYVFRTASYQTLGFMFMFSLVDWFFGNGFEVFLNLPIFLIIIIVGGAMIFGSLANWWANEGRYKSYLLNQKIKKGLEG